MNPGDVNLYVVGFMGTGKSTVGRAVAHHMGFSFLDSDHEIERQCGKTVAEIFAEQGEPEFRRLEREFIEGGHAQSRTVVACGGGLVIPPGMLDLVRARGVIVCLHATIETILERTERHSHRPLLNVGDPQQRVRELYAQRAPIYRGSGTVILTDARPLRDVVAHVIRVWERDARPFALAR